MQGISSDPMIVKADNRGRRKAAASLSLLVFMLYAGAWSPLCPTSMAATPSTETSAGSVQAPEGGSEQERERIKAAQDKMLGDPETVRLIEELKKDPSMQEILKDEELLKAIERGDLSQVEGDPKIKALMDSPAFQKILKKNQ